MSDAVPIIECRGVSKRYRRHVALDALDLVVREGEIFGFLGPNGAGKTTLIRMLVGLAIPTDGEISMFGEDLLRHRERAVRYLGAVVEAPIFYDYMSARENLRCLASLGAKVSEAEIDRAVEIVGLQQAINQRVRTFSYGMKQRLGIAQALLPASRLLVLDEPTNGLDPLGIAGVRKLIHILSREHGITIFLSSHLLQEVELLCDRVAIIDRGCKVLEATVSDLQTDSIEVLVRVCPGEGSEQRLRDAGAVEVAGDTGRFAAREADIPALVRRLVAADLDILEVEPVRRRLEDVFIEHTQQGDLHGRADTIRAEKASG